MNQNLYDAAGPRILIVDDNTANLRLLTSLLSEEGYTVHPASDGELALEFLGSTLPELIMLDIRMPGMDGFELCRQLKSDPRTSAIPVIFISILENEGDKVKGFEVGGVDFITKPFQPKEVLARVKTHLHLRELTERLEQKVDERTEKLMAANERLRQEIIERQQAEEAVRELNLELERRVIERTAQLEVANQELEAFCYSISHDLRAPLRAIGGFSRIVQDEYGKLLDREGNRYLDTIYRNTLRMSELIDDLLAFSRMSRTGIVIGSVNMAELAREVFEELRGAVPERNIVLRLGDLPSCAGDQALLRQVLVNLIANAIKFTAARPEAVIEVGGAADARETTYWVKDNGVGFDMRYVAKLFGVFQRLHSIDEFEGTGIGLAIVKRIVTGHGGRVRAEGRLGEGATIYFTLPRNERARPA